MTALGDEELLAEMRAALEEMQSTSDRVRKQVRDAATTVRDKEQRLSVTVGGHGELSQITFHGDAYRDLAPAELAELIVKTAKTARDGAQRKAMAGTSVLAGDLNQLRGAAKSATSVDELIEGIVSMVSVSGRPS